MTSLEQQLKTGATQLGLTLTDAQYQSLLTLVTELADWNTKVNLTAIRDPLDMVHKHLLDSLSIHQHLHGKQIADIGTGAGFPGLPLAIAFPDRHFTLIDSIAKKTRFIDHAVAKLALTNVTVVTARAESFHPPHKYDSVLSRALSKVSEFVRLTGHLCAKDGRLLAMKGQYPHDEIATLPKGWKLIEVHRLAVPGLDAERHLVELAPL